SIHPQPAEFGTPPAWPSWEITVGPFPQAIFDDDITCLEGFATDITVICLDLTQYGII
uniref:Uncharacterized protein n=1 Tax=Xiphophorus maculatus TaxID=8083 RepID=A0A3B5QSH6_XIPMA